MSSTILLPPRAQLCIRYCSNKQQQQQEWETSFIVFALNKPPNLLLLLPPPPCVTRSRPTSRSRGAEARVRRFFFFLPALCSPPAASLPSAHPPSHCALVSARGGYNRVQQAKDRRTEATGFSRRKTDEQRQRSGARPRIVDPSWWIVTRRRMSKCACRATSRIQSSTQDPRAR
jgi:hypothetical protein